MINPTRLQLAKRHHDFNRVNTKTCESCNTFPQLYNALLMKNSQLYTVNFYKHNYQYTTQMSNILYIIAIILIVLWATGYYAYDLGNLIHVLLVIAVIAILFRLIRGRRML